MLLQTPGVGFSGEALWIDTATKEPTQRLRDSEALGNAAARRELDDVWHECQAPNWDGYDAKPVTWETWRNARRLLDSLSLGGPLPTIGAEPDGDVTFEWHRTPRLTLSVSVTLDGELHYAALIGPKRLHGTLPFFGGVPDELQSLIEKVTGA